MLHPVCCNEVVRFRGVRVIKRGKTLITLLNETGTRDGMRYFLQFYYYSGKLSVTRLSCAVLRCRSTVIAFKYVRIL